LGKKIIRDGKRVTRCIRDLINEGYILAHKKGNTVSPDPTRIMEIREFVIKQASRI
jgi:hypothetical protein